MNKSILSSFESHPYFTIADVKQLCQEKPGATGSIQTSLYRWMKTGQLYQLKNGVYMTRQFFRMHRPDVDFSSAVSAILIPQSYLSTVYVLQRYSILTEITYPISAITLKHTRVIVNKLGTFTYSHIKPDLFTGFIEYEYMGIPIHYATLAKALFDYLYLRSTRANLRSRDYDLAEDLRLNLDEFSERDRDEFAEFVEMSKSRKMNDIMNNLKRNIWRS